MPSDVTRDEFKHLTTRVDVVEREVEGEKLVSRHILMETRRNTDVLAGVLTRLDGVETRLGGVETRLTRVEGTLNGLVKTLPRIVGDAVRTALRGRGKR